jgi:hypothetical protein
LVERSPFQQKIGELGPMDLPPKNGQREERIEPKREELKLERQTKEYTVRAQKFSPLGMSDILCKRPL